MQEEFSNIAFIGETPDLSEGAQIMFADEIRRGGFVFFEKKEADVYAVKAVDLEDLENCPHKIYRVDRDDEGRMVFEQSDIEQLTAAINVQTELDRLLGLTFNNLSFFYRDNNLSDELIEKYRRGLIIREFGFTDASYLAGGLAAKNRFLIATAQAKDLSQMPPLIPAQGLVVVNRSSFFKVLDTEERDEHTQIVLLHIPEELSEFFDSGEELSEIEQQIVAAARADFEKSLNEDAVLELTQPEWLDRTVSPLGMSDGGEFFSLTDSE